MHLFQDSLIIWHQILHTERGITEQEVWKIRMFINTYIW